MSYYQFYQPFSGVVRHMIILNVLIYFGSLIVFEPVVQDDATGAIEALGRLRLAAFMPGSEHYEPYQIVTYMFMHADIAHLAFNMLSLYFFGPMVEMAWGHKRFLSYYLFCGIGAWALHMGVQWWELSKYGIDPTMWNGSMLGASGAVFGVLVAFGYMFPNQVIQLLIPPIPIRAKYFVLIMAGVELYYGVRGDASGVARFAHLGGALSGFLLIMFWYRFRFRN